MLENGQITTSKIGFTLWCPFLFESNTDKRSVLEGILDKLPSFGLILFGMNFYFGALHTNVALECNV